MVSLYKPPSTTWSQWVQNPSWVYPTGTWSTAAYAQDYVWNTWINNTTTATTMGVTVSTATALTIQDNTWARWQDMGHVIQYGQPETQEQRQARLDREQVWREEASARRLAQQERLEGAQERAMELLMLILTPEERLWHDQHDEIAVRSASGRLYVIEKRSVHGNIREIDEHGCLLGRICVAPGMYDGESVLPLADGWVGQYLAIKHDEEHLRRTGNWSSRRECQQPNVPILGQQAA